MLFFVLDIIKDNKNMYRNYYFTNYEVRPGSILSMPQTEIKMERTGNIVTLTNTGKYSRYRSAHRSTRKDGSTYRFRELYMA